MSEDDVDMTDGQSSARVDRDRRAPRFSWTVAYERTFFRSLCDSVQLGFRDNNSFHPQAWERAAQALQDSHGAYPAKSHLINKSDNARKRFRLWRGLRENPEFVYNSLTHTVTANEDAWRAHIEREPLSRALRGRPFDNEEFMEILYPDVIGSGGAPKRIMKPRRRGDGQSVDDMEMPGTAVLHLPLDSTSSQPVGSPPDEQRTFLSQTPTGSTNSAPAQSHQSPAVASTRCSTAQMSALTPPDESANQARKRALPQASSEPALDVPPSLGTPTTLQVSASPEKRMRRCFQVDEMPATTAPVPSTTALSPSGTTPLMDMSGPVICDRSQTDGSSGTETSQRWQEMALDLFFREFCDQNMDLQIKISEMVLRDEHRALVFCKMPWRVRQHWFKRLAEKYQESVPAGG
ncbi:hypothetical protein CDD82_3626 [Ophiocordyceps australis]|uniref:Myb/SANT-like domain-containing protein n=1 Tax=Ophiocordyceps australis TaxID=1399860 RepID=A0A2C5ZUQ8_9HYPO|nr:hypothetical protein CDD82_3626 [Ophiocordyceps australis]